MTCPAIVAEGDSTIELSTYERITGTITSIACKGFGRHLKGDVHSVTCLATGAWSPAVPTLECTYDLDSKETVYVAVIVVCAALFLFACCWISAAAFCCRSRSRRTWGNRWFGERWFAGQSRDKFVDERIVRYEDKNRSKVWEAFYKENTSVATVEHDDNLEDNWFNKQTTNRSGRTRSFDSDSIRKNRRNDISASTDARNMRGVTVVSVHDRPSENFGSSQAIEDLTYSQSRDVSRIARPSGNHGYTAPFDFYDYMHSYQGYTVDSEAHSNNIASRYYDLGAALSTDGSTDSRGERLRVTNMQDHTSRTSGHVPVDSLLDALYTGYMHTKKDSPKKF